MRKRSLFIGTDGLLTAVDYGEQTGKRFATIIDTGGIEVDASEMDEELWRDIWVNNKDYTGELIVENQQQTVELKPNDKRKKIKRFKTKDAIMKEQESRIDVSKTNLRV